MSNVKTGMSKKGMLIALVIAVLFLGGGGGYLLWRVNQKDTVAPIDSDASVAKMCRRCKVGTCTLNRAADGNCYGDSSGEWVGCTKPNDTPGCCTWANTEGYECGTEAYEITFVAGSNGSVSPVKETPKPGGTATSTATPNSGYEFKEWTKAGTVVGTSATLKVDNVQADATYTATFKETEVEKVTLTYTAGANGKIKATNGEMKDEVVQTIPKGSSGTEVTATPNSGYKFLTWSDGVKEAERKDSNVGESKKYTATFSSSNTCGDGVCSGDETPASCPADCGSGSICGDGVCSSDETPASCPADCDGGSGTVPDTAIFEGTKDTIIFGIVVLMIGIGWTWLSTLPKRAYSSISKASAEIISNTKVARERDIRESRRNRLERKLK